MSTTLRIKRLHPDAVLPTYGTAGAACFDLTAIDAGRFNRDSFAHVYRTGLAVEVPEGHALMIYSRSGDGFNRGVRLSNCVGVIDSDYRGEVLVALHHDGDTFRHDLTGKRIAQAMLVPVPRVSFEVVDELSDTTRGAGGFGSTGT